MKLRIGEYKIETDAKSFSLHKRGIVQAEKEGSKKKVNPENVGKEVWTPLGYYSYFDQALRAVPNFILLEQDDIRDAIKAIQDFGKVVDSLQEEIMLMKGGK